MQVDLHYSQVLLINTISLSSDSLKSSYKSMKLLTALVYLSTLPFVSMAAEKPTLSSSLSTTWVAIGCFPTHSHSPTRPARPGRNQIHALLRSDRVRPIAFRIDDRMLSPTKSKNNNLVSVHPELHSKEILSGITQTSGLHHRMLWQMGRRAFATSVRNSYPTNKDLIHFLAPLAATTVRSGYSVTTS